MRKQLHLINTYFVVIPHNYKTIITQVISNFFCRSKTIHQKSSFKCHMQKKLRSIKNKYFKTTKNNFKNKLLILFFNILFYKYN